MSEEFVVRDILFSISLEKQKLTEFLSLHGLVFEQNIEYAVGLFLGEELVGCGCAAGNILKCFALNPELRGQNALGTLIAHLSRERFQEGHTELFVVTRPANSPLFIGCGFYLLAKTDDVALLENRKDGPLIYAQSLIGAHPAADAGAIVMNCNPFTLGHRYLIEYAAARCPQLYIFVVEEDRSAFPFEVRYRLVKEGTSDLKNVQVCPSGPYMISAATFPSYFLKKHENAVRIQSALDINLFATQIAPAFHITKRFAGEEPLDPVTQEYNAAMADVLPRHGVAYIQIPRKQIQGAPISASRVRALMAQDDLEQAMALVPTATANYLKESMGIK